MDLTFRVAACVVETANRAKPADSVLRTELKASKLPRAETRKAAHLVFAFYRWSGWLGAGSTFDRLKQAAALDERFRSNPDAFSLDELRKAVPEWTPQETETTLEWLKSLQTAPAVWLRARKGMGKALADRLGESTTAEGLLADAVRYRGPEDMFRSEAFQAGEFEIQDIGSQAVGVLSDPKPGETWWDACAGEGGKLLHLSDLMENKGLIWATDRADWRLKKLKLRAARAKAFNYRTALWDGSAKLPTKTKFDGVLIDAPCSGLGTWQRNPHARWTTTPADVKELAALQRQLVMNAAAAVKPGGKLIYAVCTLTRSETDEVADWCSQQLSQFEPMILPALPSEPPAASARKWIWPQLAGGNGMFVSAWRRLP